MRHNKWIAFLLFATLLGVMTEAASAQKPIPYDNFNHALLDPLKWTLPACSQANGQEMECVREIQDGQLHLAHRGFGNRDSDVGFQFGAASLYFIDPSSITSITTDLTVRSIQEVGCAANPEFGASAHIDAIFFNTGTGNSNDDVGGHIAMGRFVSDPPGQLTAYGQISQGNNYFAYFALGTLPVGTPVTMTLTWDQPRHQFLAGWTNGTTHVKTQVTMPYALPDGAPPANPYKTLTLNTFPSNCTANLAWVFIDGDFDNVFTE